MYDRNEELFIYVKSISINKFGFIFKNNLYLTDFDFGSRMYKRSNDQHGINLIGCWEYITQFILFQLLVGNSSAVDFSCSLVKLVIKLEGLPPLDESYLYSFYFGSIEWSSIPSAN